MSESNIIMVQTMLNILFHVSYTPLGENIAYVMSWFKSLSLTCLSAQKQNDILHKQCYTICAICYIFCFDIP